MPEDTIAIDETTPDTDGVVVQTAELDPETGEVTMIAEPETEAATDVETAAADDEDEAETADADTVMEQPWRGVLMLEGEPTSDGRVFTNITWRDLPLSLMWQRETSHGGVQTGGEFLVGRIDTIERVGNEIRGTGVYDLGSENAPNEDARELVRHMAAGNLRGVSIEAALGDGTVECDEENDRLLIDGAEIGAAANVPFPAFRDAYIELDGDPVPAAVTASAEDTVTAAGTPEVVAPPAEWFENPNLTERMGLHVEENGRIWGHIYGWGECHRGFADRCVQIPRGGSYAHIVDVDGRGVRCADGSFVQTGPIIISADHADTRLSWLGAKDHYAHTGLAAADVVCGEDDHGIWVAGMVRPGTPPELVHALTASGPSGDWRRIGGRLELVSILMVNMQGYPAVRRSLVAAFSGGEPITLIMHGNDPQHAASCSCGGGGQSAALTEALARIERVAATFEPLVQQMRADQSSAIAEELDAMLDETDADETAERTPLGDLIAAASV